MYARSFAHLLSFVRSRSLYLFRFFALSFSLSRALLQGRTDELNEDEAEAAAKAAADAEDEDAAATKARGEDLLGEDDDADDKEDAGAAKNDEQEEGMASKEDVERMKRMFGSS